MKNYLLLSFALLNACGGGGNGGSTSQIAVPLPTANINSSAGSTYQGDNVTLTWSSTNATTCISSGAWSNTISTSGSQSVPVSALGSNIFTLTCGTGSQTSIVQATVTTTVKPYFVEVPNAFPDPGYIYALANPGSVNATHIGGIVFATPIKKLPNGSSGIIFSAGASNPDPTQACFGKLYIFEYKNGVFNDVTTSMLDGVNSLNGFPSVTAVDDINGDGITDFVSGVTQDCGRTTQTNSNALVGAQPVALVSNAQTGKYKIIHFSYPDGWENVRILTENDGSKSIALGGYNFSNAQNGGTYKYKFNGTTFVAVNNDFPHPNAQGFTIYSASGEPGFSALIQAGESSAVESFIKDANGNWTSGGTINSSYPVLGYSVYTGWTGGFSTVPIINLGGNAVIGAPNRGLIVTNSCKIRISPTSDYSVLLMLPVNVISNYIPGEPIADSMMSTGRISPGVKWLGASISKGVLTQSDPIIINELTTNNGGGFNQFDCRDVNGDGYDDLVGYALWQGDSNTNAFPLIYLNQKNGTFKRTTVGDTMSFRTGVQANQHTSMMTDIDGDGIEDLIIFPGSPGGASLTGSMKFYKGLKKLDK